MNIKRIRRISQIFFLVIVGLISLNHYLAEIGKTIWFLGSASLHAICPFGAVETFGSLIMYNKLVPKLHESTLVLFGIIVFLSILLGPVVCGFACPLGTFQELVSSIGKKIFKQRFNNFVPNKVAKKLSYFKYVVLIYILYVTTVSLKLAFLDFDPYYALFNFWSSEVPIGALVVLGLTLVGSLFVERPWCRYMCPFGALVGFTNKFSLFKIKRNKSTCISCGKCDKVCPVGIEVSNKDVITDLNCIRCLECTSERACPVENTVQISMDYVKGGNKHETK